MAGLAATQVIGRSCVRTPRDTAKRLRQSKPRIGRKTDMLQTTVGKSIGIILFYFNSLKISYQVPQKP